MDDSPTPVGKWYLNANGFRLELNIISTASGLSANLKQEGGNTESVSNISWNATSRWFEFCRNGHGIFQWYRMSLVYGTAAGRFSQGTAPDKPAYTSYVFHVTGWSPDLLDSGIVPRVWDVILNSKFLGVLRIDRNSLGTLCGRLKVYYNLFDSQEELEHDLEFVFWDGTILSFTRNAAGLIQTYIGTATGRFVRGIFFENGLRYSWAGTRSQVLGFGFGSRLPERSNWQARTRAGLVNLTEGMRLANVDIPSVTVTEEPCVGCPFLGSSYPSERDDNPDAWPPDYTLKRLRFSIPPGNRFDPRNLPPARVFHGYLAIPKVAPPQSGYRAVVVTNGHGGDAKQLMSKGSGFWYGESAARRHLIVLAIDIGHRNEWNDSGVNHPKIVGVGYTTSDWEEDGERAFSIRRAIDYLQSRSDVRADRIFIMGLSLGGEVATITAALDPRIVMAISAGYSPDMHVMDHHGNHECYRWNNADIHEYIDVSDFQSLIAPRPLVVETGLADFTFSSLATPWTSDKQVTRRARFAYGSDADKLIHYLHYDAHSFHVGDQNPTNPSRPQCIQSASITKPKYAGDVGWQTDTSTFERSLSLYHLVNEFFP